MAHSVAKAFISLIDSGLVAERDVWRSEAPLGSALRGPCKRMRLGQYHFHHPKLAALRRKRFRKASVAQMADRLDCATFQALAPVRLASPRATKASNSPHRRRRPHLRSRPLEGVGANGEEGREGGSGVKNDARHLSSKVKLKNVTLCCTFLHVATHTNTCHVLSFRPLGHYQKSCATHVTSLQHHDGTPTWCWGRAARPRDARPRARVHDFPVTPTSSSRSTIRSSGHLNAWLPPRASLGWCVYVSGGGWWWWSRLRL